MADEDEIMTNFLFRLDGSLKEDKYTREWGYSEYTYGVDYVSELKVGGHDLQNKLFDLLGKFVIVKISIGEGNGLSNFS